MSNKDQIPTSSELRGLGARGVDIGGVQVIDVLDRMNKGLAKKAKVRVNTHGRMKRSQAEVGRLLQEVYGETFAQTPGSGSYGTYNKGKVDPGEAKALVGDVRVRNMRFIIEVKSGYAHVSLDDLFIPDGERGGSSSKSELRDWFQEVEGYEKTSMTPGIIFWKKPKRRFVIIVREQQFLDFCGHWSTPPDCLRFEGWCMFDVAYLLALPKPVLFET
jgi:hypothetical protein